MRPNPVLKKLGFSDTDRVVIIHTDDIGMCQASVLAFEELWDFGLISSSATMVPCPWFLEAAKVQRKKPQIDLGVHITLTSEWDTYRWGPISTRNPQSGLIDEEGYFYHTSEDAQKFGKPEAVAQEIRAQVERTIAAGIDVTHIDTHMGTVASINFIPAYVSLAMEFGLPPMIMRLSRDAWIRMGLDEQTAELAVGMIAQLEDFGVPLIDQIASLDLDCAQTPEERIAYAKETLGSLNAGITHFIIHPSTDTPELRAITPDWRCRVADYKAFLSENLRDYISRCGIQVVGYRSLKELM